MSKKFFFFLLIFSSIFLQAHLNQSIIVDRAIENEIYKSHVWHRLLHLDANKSPAINSNSFLLSYDNFSPKEELIKTINYFFENEENICRYPARYLYIQNELQLNELNFSLSNCKDFDEYRNSICFCLISEMEPYLILHTLPCGIPILSTNKTSI